jgi:hypothetical protein
LLKALFDTFRDTHNFTSFTLMRVHSFKHDAVSRAESDMLFVIQVASDKHKDSTNPGEASRRMEQVVFYSRAAPDS